MSYANDFYDPDDDDQQPSMGQMIGYALMAVAVVTGVVVLLAMAQSLTQ